MYKDQFEEQTGVKEGEVVEFSVNYGPRKKGKLKYHYVGAGFLWVSLVDLEPIGIWEDTKEPRYQYWNVHEENNGGSAFNTLHIGRDDLRIFIKGKEYYVEKKVTTRLDYEYKADEKKRAQLIQATQSKIDKLNKELEELKKI